MSGKHRTTRGIGETYLYLFKVGPHEFIYPTLARAKAEALKAMRRWYRNHGDAAVTSPLIVYRRRGGYDTQSMQVYHLGMGTMKWERRR